jgi:diguanylate cyclase (GGDEF)-like protein
MALRDERIRLWEAHARLQEAAIEDPLTRLLNRRRLSEDVSLIDSQFARERTTLSALMVDLDAFKAYNDALGHQAGDRVLRQVATSIRQAVRTVDRVYRYGGEELLVLMDEGDTEAAHLAGERIVAAVRALRIVHPGSPGGFLTVSVGAAATDGRSMGAWEVIGQADRALYVAKTTGRDRAVPSATASATPPLRLVGTGSAA